MADKETKLTPMDIHNKEFKHRGRNGYDRYEVDSFLDDVVDSYGDALDQVVDLKNEVVSLNKKVEDMQAQVDEYSNMKKSLISAQQTVDQLKGNAEAEAEAKRILDDAKKQAQTEVGYQKQQQEVISNDYKRLKKQIGEFRSHMQAMLQDEINNLNDETWQHALDEYFHTERFYPGNGAEPIGEEEEIANEATIDDEDVDNDDVNDVNSSQEPDDLDMDLSDDSDDDDDSAPAPKPMTGDSPHHETINLKPEMPKTSSGPTIVFPDDYKK
ncbi:DivIVA domain-containing protein [Lactobacillus helveticus]|nr:DivIVA domain-containing protein [Lactobacillus helveticus]ADX70484.1 Cell-division initiation protein [Lactobacillus helveticus H10]NRN71503.1 Septum site-determining protein DivIVA [Lactobacillus helveticus]NRN73734.1 Septum site-determining protein DivIVA [Lactobacillus helveticus]NRN76015.1 Septum site-determining protein DivIVA [Lactobacillus helveticus]NRN78180.1 Septum site-determining protein DivIVA [Lactobacillus helveticus]